MTMKYFEYEDKANDNQKAKAVDAESVIDTMEDLEQFNGTTENKLVDNWYEVKRELKGIVLAEIEKETTKKTK